MDSVHIHLILNHIPVLGTLFGIAIFLWGFVRQNEDIQRISLYLFVFSALVAIPVYLSGEPAEEAVEHLAGVSETWLEQHEEFAEKSFIAMELLGIMALVTAVLRFKQQVLPAWLLPLLIVLSVCTGSMMGYTAYLGGQIRHAEIRTGVAPEEKPKKEEHSHGAKEKKQEQPGSTISDVKGDED